MSVLPFGVWETWETGDRRFMVSGKKRRKGERLSRILSAMARWPRVVVAGVAQHVTQRGNGRQFLLATDSERMVYLDLLRQAVRAEGVAVVGYCLMSNHVHLAVIPRRAEALARALKHPHGRYAAYGNAAHTSSGHAWQERFYSCPLDEAHGWQALRYAELNPVRAKMVAEAVEWPRSSVHARLYGKEEQKKLLSPWPLEEPRDYLPWLNQSQPKEQI